MLIISWQLRAPSNATILAVRALFWLSPAASSIIQHHHRKLERQRQMYLKMMFQSYPARNSWKDNDRLCRRWSKKWHWLYWGNSKLLDLSCIFFATKQNRQRMSTSFSFDITLMAMGHPQYHHIWLNWNLRSSCVKHGISITKYIYICIYTYVYIHMYIYVYNIYIHTRINSPIIVTIGKWEVSSIDTSICVG